MLATEARAIDLGEPKDSPILALARLLWSDRKRLRKAIVVGLLLGGLVAALIPTTYTAKVQLMPPDGGALSGSMGTLGALIGAAASGGGSGASASIGSSIGTLLGVQKPGDLVVGVLGCSTIANRMIDRFDLRKVYWTKTYVSARSKLAGNTEIHEDKRSGIIFIQVTDHDRARAAAMAQAYVTELNQLLAHVNTSAASREREFLEQRLVTINNELHEAANELSQYASQNSTLDPQVQAKAMVEATATLQGKLIAAQSELSGLEQIYTPENVRVRSLQAHIAELQVQLNKMGGKDYEGSNKLPPGAIYPPLRQLPVLAVKYGELYRRVKIDETVFAALTEEYELARVQEAKETPSVKILDAAQPPERKSGPHRILITLTGSFLSFLFTGCWIVAEEFWSEIDPHEPHKEFITREILPSVKGRLKTWKQAASHLFH
jgi:uncharacterized protein involved in exopolysaccharide biosynthesis